MHKIVLSGLLIVGLIGLFLGPIGAAQQSTQPAQIQEKTVLNFWGWARPDKDYAGVVKAFEAAYPNIHIVIRAIKATEYNTVLTTALQGGVGPDVFMSRINPMPSQFAKAGFVEPLDKLVPLLAYYEKRYLASVSYQGRPYAVPSTLVTDNIIYNKEIFDHYSISEPKTWKDFIDICKTLKANGVTPISMYSEGWAVSSVYFPDIAATMVDDTWAQELVGGKASFTDPEFVKVLELGASLKPYFIKGWEALTYADAAQLFAHGKAAMIFDADWGTTMYPQLNPELKLGTFLCPPIKENGHRRIYWRVDGGWSFNARLSGKKREAAILFLNFLGSSVGGEILARDHGMPSLSPGFTGMLTNPLLRKLIAYTKEEGVPVPFLRGGPLDWYAPTVSSLMSQYGPQVLLGTLSPEKAAAQIQSGVESQQRK